MTPKKATANKRERALAEALISMARTGGMPDTFRLTDERMLLALEVLGRKRFDQVWEEKG
jgi:hypothetical protein